MIEYSNKWILENKDRRKVIMAKYYNTNCNDILNNCKIYRKSNSDKNGKIRKESYRKRKSKDPLYKLSESIRCSIRMSIKKRGYMKNNKPYEILGCSSEEFKLHLESKFESWMNWDNHGLYNGELDYGWDLDHIIPISSAKTEDCIIKLNHYTNFQPLCGFVNRNIKRNQII